MTFEQQLTITLVDKLLSGALLLIAGFLLNAVLERRKASDELKKAIALERVNAYRELWKLSIIQLDGTSREELRNEFAKWYNGGGALFLSFNAARHFFKAKKMLADGSANAAEIRAVLSRLRTELKHDCGTYGRKEADTHIPETG